MSPSVSIIIPAYNSMNTILSSLDSALKQGVDCEVIIVDDCSTDGTFDAVKHLIDDKTVIYYRNKENCGVAYSRNFGVRVAQGEYIAFLDADDVWRKGKLRAQLRLLEKTGAVLCGTARELMKEDGSLTGKIIKVPSRIGYKKLLYGNVINCSSVLIRSDVMKNYPMTDDHLHEDYITWLRILKDNGEAVFLKKPYLLYRLSKSGKSANKLQSAKSTFGVYRRLGFGLFRSCRYFAGYAVSAVIKYSI